MGMNKYECFMQYMFIIETIVNNMKSRHVSKVIDVFQRTCSCLLDSWKNKYQVHITSLSVHWLIYWHKPVYISAGQGSSSEHAKCTYPILFIITFVCLSVPLTVLMQLNLYFINIFYCFCCQTTGWIWKSDWNVTHYRYRPKWVE